jgi:hypothetical protein
MGFKCLKWRCRQPNKHVLILNLEHPFGTSFKFNLMNMSNVEIKF